MLLEKQLELFDHELVDGASLDEVRDQALHRVPLVHNDPLNAEVGHIDVDVELSLAIVACRRVPTCLLWRVTIGLGRRLAVVFDGGRCRVATLQVDLLLGRLLLFWVIVVALKLVFSLLEGAVLLLNISTGLLL